MTETENINPAALPTVQPSAVEPKQINYSVLRAGLRKARGIKKNFTYAQDKQLTLLLYLNTHDSISPQKVRSMMHFTKITSYRVMGRLKRAGFIKFTGSRNNGVYVITETGKKFIESGGRLDG